MPGRLASIQVKDRRRSTDLGSCKNHLRKHDSAVASMKNLELVPKVLDCAGRLRYSGATHGVGANVLPSALADGALPNRKCSSCGACALLRERGEVCLGRSL